MTPETSIVLTVYNRALYLESAIQSILAQTKQGFELIIWDDGSSDQLSRSTVFDLDPAVFDRDLESLKRSYSNSLSFVVRLISAVPRYLTADFGDKIPRYLTAWALKCKSSRE